MHLLIAHASGSGEAARAALAAGAGLGAADWPHLARLLARAGAPAFDRGDEYTASPPHERALARLRGWQGSDGCWPTAARAAALDGIDTGTTPVALLTPAHWHLGTEQVSMLDPAGLQLDEAASRALFEAVAGLFDAGAGWRLAWGAPLRWYAMHASLQGLKSAALDRVIGRNVDLWLADAPAARALRRLQVEAQMLLHTHPVNQAREARGALPVNSFWWSGCGARQGEAAAAAAVQVHETLAAPLLAGDWPAWQAAWRALDAGPLREALAANEAGEALQLTLCGERHAATWSIPAPGRWARLGRLAGFGPRSDRVDVAALLGQL